MKKAKIILTAIAVLAVVGGAMAFKAKKFGIANVYCLTTTDLAQPLTKISYKTSAANPENLVSTTLPCTTVGISSTRYFTTSTTTTIVGFTGRVYLTAL